jgi:hypothetical protein
MDEERRREQTIKKKFQRRPREYHFFQNKHYYARTPLFW